MFLPALGARVDGEQGRGLACGKRDCSVCVCVCPWGLRKKYGEVGREQGKHSRIFLAVELEVPDQLAFSVLGKPGC